jgi:CelD/BcsL family acetyltransferase involved in cellulose biosynthesis
MASEARSQRPGPRARVDDFGIEIAASYEDVAERWKRLRANGSSLAFQGETWLAAWYGIVGPAERVTPLPTTVVNRATGEDLMGLPLIGCEIDGLRYIEFADCGLTDYNAPIIGGRRALLDRGALMKALRATLPRGDAIRFAKMPRIVGDTINPLVGGGSVARGRLNGNLLHAPDDWNDWHWKLERTFRKELERSWRVFERRSGVFRRVTELSDARRVFAALKQLQRDRIAELGLRYILDEAHNDAFYDRVLETGLGAGEAVLTTLEANGETVAGLLGIVNNDHYCMVRLGVATGDWRNCSPGRILIEQSMKSLHADGYRLFDFTIGDYAYKRRLGAAEIALTDVNLPLSWRGAPAVATDRARAALRSSPGLLRAARWLRDRAAKRA